MRLLQAWQAKGSRTYLVGDDWQSIYGFAGSSPDAIAAVSTHLGHTATIALDQTYRFNRRIMEPANEFIQANPKQTQRTMQPNQEAPDHGVKVIYSDKSPADKLRKSVEEIRRGDPGSSILVLGRYQKHGIANYSTIHAAKGLEADYTVIVGLNAGENGFPDEKATDSIVRLVETSKPETAPVALPEEPRLMYVAMTGVEKQPSSSPTAGNRHCSQPRSADISW